LIFAKIEAQVYGINWICATLPSAK
jgi:hypothetical protein